jgi:hypothetical protein
MSVFGGMSKGERNRIKIRVRTAMASQTQLEGRYLGGRPPYGYTLTDLGRHPNPAKAAEGKRLHGLAPDPQTAPVVQRIFDMYIAGYGIYAIAEALTCDDIPAHPPKIPHATATATGWPGPRAPCGSSSPTPATPAAKSGTSSAPTRSCSTSTTSRSATHPSCGGTTPTNGSPPRTWPTSR